MTREPVEMSAGVAGMSGVRCQATNAFMEQENS